jgi:integrase
MKTRKQAGKKPRWSTTQYANLIRYVPSGKYYARIRVQGNLIRWSLKTDRISVAKLRLADFEKQERRKVESRAAAASGNMTFREAVSIFRERLKADVHLKPRSKDYREERVAALLRSWPGLGERDVGRITRQECLDWSQRFGERCSPVAFNNTIGTLRMILDICLDAGARYDNPARGIKRKRILLRPPELPSQETFLKFVSHIENSGRSSCYQAAALIRFLAFGGFRKSEAANIIWADCDFDKGKITVRGDAVTSTKNSEFREVPMIPDMRALLSRLKAEHPGAKPTDRVMKAKECQITMDRAAKQLDIPRITHHDLRHLFATRCIESSVDIPTVSRWLGHKDGGALAMKTYGHLRDQHSANMAQKVVFSEPAPNIVPNYINRSAPPDSETPASTAMDKKAIAEAKAKYGYPWWASKNPLEVFWGQVNEPVPILPVERFHECARQAMGRDVFAEELADRESLKDEFIARTPETTCAELTRKIHPRQTAPRMTMAL